jgi:hypothetical protein
LFRVNLSKNEDDNEPAPSVSRPADAQENQSDQPSRQLLASALNTGTIEGEIGTANE